MPLWLGAACFIPPLFSAVGALCSLKQPSARRLPKRRSLRFCRMNSLCVSPINWAASMSVSLLIFTCVSVCVCVRLRCGRKPSLCARNWLTSTRTRSSTTSCSARDWWEESRHLRPPPLCILRDTQRTRGSLPDPPPPRQHAVELKPFRGDKNYSALMLSV